MANPFLRSTLATVAAALLIASAGCGGGGGAGGDKAANQKPAGGAAGDPIKVGAFFALTGGQASFGQSAKKGIDLAVEEINAAGGVLGRPINVIMEDDRSQSSEAQTVAVKLIQQDKVVALLGEVASSNSLAAAPVAQRSAIPMISPASTNPKVTETGDYIFRICYLDPFQGESMAKFARNTLKVTRVAIFKDVKSDYSVGLSEYFRKTFTELGGEIVAEESFSQGDSDFKAQLTTIKGTNPEAIFLPNYYTEVGQIGRQARELGMTAVLLGGDGWDSPKTIEIGGDAMEGSYFSNHYAEEDPNPVVQGFITKFKAKYNNETPDAMGVLGYDVTKVLVDAIGRAGTTDGKPLRDAIAATKDFNGVSGKVTIDEGRNARKTLVIIKIEGGKLKYTETMNP